MVREKDELLSACAAAVVAMAEDGWLFHGVEGMTETQNVCFQAYKAIEAASAAGKEG